MLDTLTTVALFLLLWFVAIVLYDVLFEGAYPWRVRRYRYSVTSPDGFVTEGLAANLRPPDGSFREKVCVVRLGFVAHWGVPNALDIMHQFQKALPAWTIFVPSPPGFGGTTYPVGHFPEGEVTFASFARASMEGVIAEGAREVILVGASMGANIAAKEARFLLEHSKVARPVMLASFAGVIQKMEGDELRRRFLHPKGLVDRLAIKWWKRGVPLSTRIATRGLIRAALHETLWDIVLHRGRLALANMYQNMLADTELQEDLLGLRGSGALTFAIFGDRDRLTAEGHVAFASEHPWTGVGHPWVGGLHNETHLGLCVDGRYQASVTKNLMRPRSDLSHTT